MFNSGPSYGESVGQYRGEPIYHASLGPEEYRALLSGIGFEVIAHAREDWQTGGGCTIWLARRRWLSASIVGARGRSCRLQPVAIPLRQFDDSISFGTDTFNQLIEMKSVTRPCAD